jgi:hypothetical protein
MFYYGLKYVLLIISINVLRYYSNVNFMNDTKIIIIVDVYYFLNKIYEHKSIYQKKRKDRVNLVIVKRTSVK